MPRLSPDGARVWIGSATGLLSANTTDAPITFTKVSDAPVQWVFASEAVLYACGGSTTLPYALAAPMDRRATFTPLLTLRGVRGPLWDH